MLVAIIRTQPIVLIRSAVQLLNDHPALKLNKKYSGRLEMFKIVRSFGAAMLCLGFLVSASVVLVGQDQSMPAKDAKQKEQMKDAVMISGTVSNVTDSAITIVDSKKAEHTVTVNADTKVTKAGKDGALTDVKANDVVTVEAKKSEGDTWTATKISVS